MTRKVPWIGTSWKMNKRRAEALVFADALKSSAHATAATAELFIVPPFPYIADVAARLEGTRIRVGAQNMHWEDAGAWTGEISAPMLKDCGASLIEIGHSERRTYFGETDATVALKVAAALRHGLTALVCIGDTRAEYEAGCTALALERQVAALLGHVTPVTIGQILIAYEPVWSIGEGGTPASPDFAGSQHEGIAATVRRLTGARVPILYGGSVNRENCVALATHPAIDGLFVGRAAWDAAGYLGIIAAVVDGLARG